MSGQTTVSIEGRAFHSNGPPIYAGRIHEGMKVSGLLMNAWLVQGIFDDHNPVQNPQTGGLGVAGLEPATPSL